MDNILRILQHWGIGTAKILERFHVDGSRVVVKALTEAGTVILKGQPAHVDIDFIIGVLHAHEFLGNLHHIAPQLYYRPDGTGFYRDDDYYYYMMEYVEGRQAEETIGDEWLLGKASAKLHQLTGYSEKSTLDLPAIINQAQEWFGEYSWKREFDEIVASLPNFADFRQCFVHTDIGPHNAIIREGAAVFVDLDHAGIGSLYADLGWPFIMQFVDYNKDSREMQYRFPLAKGFLDGYYGHHKPSPSEYNLLWQGAILTHISYMKSYGKEAEQPLWDILKFGMEQKDSLWEKVFPSGQA